MVLPPDTQRIVSVDDYLLTWLETFLTAKRAQGVTQGTVGFYREKLGIFAAYCETQAVKGILQITPSLIREYLLHLEQAGHNPGGIHAHYRTLKTFLFWWENETEPEGWKNPIRKVRTPRVTVEPLRGVTPEIVTQLIKTCERGTFAGDRDAAILLSLFDTGARAAEFLALNLADANQAAGDILIRKGKGRKPRYVYLGRTARKALRRYLKQRDDDHPALWVTHPRFGAGRLTYDGLRSIVTRRAMEAGIDPPGLHDFRRGFALAMLRAGTDIFTLAKLMGHAGIAVLQRYLAQTDQDTALAHRRASPADALFDDLQYRP